MDIKNLKLEISNLKTNLMEFYWSLSENQANRGIVDLLSNLVKAIQPNLNPERNYHEIDKIDKTFKLYLAYKIDYKSDLEEFRKIMSELLKKIEVYADSSNLNLKDYKSKFSTRPIAVF